MRDAPLREGSLLVGGLLLFSIPLTLLTGQSRSVSRPEVVSSVAVSEGTETEVLVYGTAGLKFVELWQSDVMRGRFEGPGDEGEFMCAMDLDESLITIKAEFVEEGRNALAVELWPEGHGEKELSLWGEGVVVEEISVIWHE